MQEAHTKERFAQFMSQLQETNATLAFFTDFGKITRNVERISIKLHQLNYLVGKADMEDAVRKLWDENSDAFDVLDILIAVRKEERKKVLDADNKVHLVADYFKTVEGVIKYINDTGLKDILQDKRVTNLVDYVFGVETGLDSNARKNRSGHIMEGRVADILERNDIPYRQEVYSAEFDNLNGLGEDSKRFDFVVRTKVRTYLIEVNFYSSGGSKLNEVARSYSELAPKINTNEGYEFVWITDGIGWNAARNKLEEAFSIIPSIYNLTSISEFVNRVKTEL